MVGCGINGHFADYSKWCCSIGPFYQIQIVNQYHSYFFYIDVSAKEFAFYYFKFQLSTLGISYNEKRLKTK